MSDRDSSPSLEGLGIEQRHLADALDELKKTLGENRREAQRTAEGLSKSIAESKDALMSAFASRDERTGLIEKDIHDLRIKVIELEASTRSRWALVAAIGTVAMGTVAQIVMLWLRGVGKG